MATFITPRGVSIFFVGRNETANYQTFLQAYNAISGSEIFRARINGLLPSQAVRIYVGSDPSELIGRDGFQGFNIDPARERNAPGYTVQSGSSFFIVAKAGQFTNYTEDGREFISDPQLTLLHELMHPSVYYELLGLGLSPVETAEARSQQLERDVAGQLNYDMNKVPPIGYQSRIGVPKPQQCFLAGTRITMADGTMKPIEDIRPGDMVLSFDPVAEKGLGPSIPGQVTRIFNGVTREIINLRGLKVTPGHVMLSDNGEWMTIGRILRADRPIHEQRDDKPVAIRARTGAVVGSLEDIPVRIQFRDLETGAIRPAIVRAGIFYAGLKSSETTAEACDLATAIALESCSLQPNGDFVHASGESFNTMPWPEGATPLDWPSQHNWVISLDDKPFTPQWIADLSMDDVAARAMNDSPRTTATSASYPSMRGPLPGFGGSAMGRNGAGALGSGPTHQPNRKERRKLAALRVVQ